MTVARLARRKAFSCLHRYEVSSWSDHKNAETFGACFFPNGHGYNYELEAFLEGPIDTETGMILNLTDVDDLLSQVVGPLDGKMLNRDVPEFLHQVPTTENLANWIFVRLNDKVNSPVRLIKIRLYEYADLWVDVWAES